MKELPAALFGLVSGLGIFCIGLTIGTFDNPEKEQVGYTYTELQEMKRKCEEDLPRKQQCTILVQYVHQQEGK